MSVSHDAEFFNANGYLAVESVLNRQQIESLRQSADRLVALGEGLSESTARFKLATFDSDATPGAVQQIGDPHELAGEWLDMVRLPRILDLVGAILGPNIALYYSMFMMKPPHQGAPAPWHQDLAFYAHDAAKLIGCQIYIDDSTAENGCLQVVPGSHREGLRNHFENDLFVTKVVGDTTEFDRRSVLCPMPAGGAVFWHSLTVHASAKNVSGFPRRALTLEYKDPSVSLLAGSFSTGIETRNVGLMVRGADPTGSLLPAV